MLCANPNTPEHNLLENTLTCWDAVTMTLDHLSKFFKDEVYRHTLARKFGKWQGSQSFSEWFQEKEMIRMKLGYTLGQMVPVLVNGMDADLQLALSSRLNKNPEDFSYMDIASYGPMVEQQINLTRRQYRQAPKQPYLSRRTDLYHRNTGTGEVLAQARWNDKDWAMIRQANACGNCGWPGHRRNECRKDPKSVVKTLTDAQKQRLSHSPRKNYQAQRPPKEFSRATKIDGDEAPEEAQE